MTTRVTYDFVIKISRIKFDIDFFHVNVSSLSAGVTIPARFIILLWLYSTIKLHKCQKISIKKKCPIYRTLQYVSRETLFTHFS